MHGRYQFYKYTLHVIIIEQSESGQRHISIPEDPV